VQYGGFYLIKNNFLCFCGGEGQMYSRYRFRIIKKILFLFVEPDRVVKGNMRCVNADLVKTNKTASVKKEYALCLMTECALEDCRDLISKYANGKNAKVSTRASRRWPSPVWARDGPAA